jgi:ATP-dependent Clp protease ATP-binding subunit ClpA
MKRDKSVNIILDDARQSATDNGRSVYTLSDVAIRLLKDETVLKAIAKSEEEINKIKKELASPLSRVMAGTEDAEEDSYVKRMKNELTSIAMATKQYYGDYNIYLPALFLGTFCESDFYNLKGCLEKHGIDRDAVYAELLRITAEKDISDSEIKIVDIAIPEEGRPKRSSYLLGENPVPAVEPLKMKTIDAGFLIDLVDKSRSYNKPFIGREDVINRTIQVLCKAEKANPLHVGEPGVGKTAVTLGLARKLLTGDVPDKIKGYHLLELNLTALSAGASVVGEWEARVQAIFDEIKKVGNVILFIDEIHTVIKSSMGGTHDMQNVIKPYLVKDYIKVIGATTYKEYNQYFTSDPALERRFMKIDIEEPSRDDSITILNGLKERYEKLHGVTYTDDAIVGAVDLSIKFLNNRYLPDKAIDLIDEAGAWKEISKTEDKTVTEADILLQLNKACGVSEKTLESNSMKAIRDLNTTLKSQVFGQDEAVDKLTEVIQIAKSGLGDDDKPMGSFLFVGPSGVGKTELAKCLADNFGMSFSRFDMSEYQESHTVSKLFGSPAGYVGYDDGGLLTSKIEKCPHSIVLFDEIEKAHPNIFKSLLQILDYGMLTDNKGKKISFRNCIIILTSNAGIADASKAGIGFFNSVNDDAIDKAVERTFPVEFRNRLSAVLKFNHLSKEVSMMIVKKEFKTMQEKLKKNGYEAILSDSAINELSNRGVSADYGAREVKRTIDSSLKLMITNQIINETLPQSFIIDYSDGEFNIKENVPEEKLVMTIPNGMAVPAGM